MNTYTVLGLMSGTSLDGVDIAYCRLTYNSDNWIYKIFNTETFPYSDAWINRLQALTKSSAEDFIQTDHAYGTYLGELGAAFIKKHHLRPDFIASHGHTIFHQPQKHISAQIGHGAYLAAAARLPVVSDFRTLDIALGGQGAPLVPIGDKLLFAEYDFCLNLGGIANISFNAGNTRLAYDTGACNMLLNTLAHTIGLAYDENGSLARSGKLNQELYKKLNEPAYFLQPYPKSLGKEWVDGHSLQDLTVSDIALEDKLHTACHHIAWHISEAIKAVPATKSESKILATGGGAFNSFLIELLCQYLGSGYKVVVPEPALVNFKEALIFAFLGVLRWRNEVNCLSSVTGASRDNVGGAVYFSG